MNCFPDPTCKYQPGAKVWVNYLSGTTATCCEATVVHCGRHFSTEEEVYLLSVDAFHGIRRFAYLKDLSDRD